MKKAIICVLAFLAIAFAIYGVINLNNKTANQPVREENVEAR